MMVTDMAPVENRLLDDAVDSSGPFNDTAATPVPITRRTVTTTPSDVPGFLELEILQTTDV